MVAIIPEVFDVFQNIEDKPEFWLLFCSSADVREVSEACEITDYHSQGVMI